MYKSIYSCVFFSIFSLNIFAQRQTLNFNKDWQFALNADSNAVFSNKNITWRTLNLPHDWSIELPFSKTAPATNQGGALPGGIGWYKKIFTIPQSAKNKIVEINFDGVYKNSEVWINGNYLGLRPNGYVNFKYDLSNFIKPFPQQNTIIVKADNSKQPNSRWYSGSGIYRDVILSFKNKENIIHESIFITSNTISKEKAVLEIGNKINVSKYNFNFYKTTIKDFQGKIVYTYTDILNPEARASIDKKVEIKSPSLWSNDFPFLYTLKLELLDKNLKVLDQVITTFGIRKIHFDKDNGFYLNNKPLKLQGVCMHHDLGLFGAAFNKTAARRQLQLLKEMGCNAIRFSHNPPASAMLDLCDEMGFLVVDEAFDMWAKKKNKYDYAKDFKQWYKQDLEAMIIRDRNHPSVFMWSIGNEIREQFDTSAIVTTKNLVAIVKNLDNTRPVTAALTETHFNKNFIAQSKALDVLGFNYKDYMYDSLPLEFPNTPILATETASALATRGVYNYPSDTTRVWPPNYKVQDSFTGGNADYTCAAYDNTFAYWGNTHERSWLAVKKRKNIAGAFVWSGFDYLGEPVPYPYPARSSYFGIIDLAGFPKDVYYMYQSEWTTKPVLHIFPHWNWNKGDTVDVWAYYNNADKVELFLNGKSLGTQSKTDTSLHVSWRVPFAAGTLKAVSIKNGKVVLTNEVKTSGEAYKIIFTKEKNSITKNDYSFIVATIVDANGNIIPTANNEVHFTIKGDAKIFGTDNGYQVDTIAFTSNIKKAFNSRVLIVVKNGKKKVNSTLTANSSELKMATIALKSF